MKIRHEQLESQLNNSLKPIYFVSGDEVLLVEEAADSVRQQALSQGYSERTVFHVTKGCDWNEWLLGAGTQSLFANRQLLELRLPTGKPGDAGAKALIRYVERMMPDNLLLIVAGKLEGAVQRAKWFKAVTDAGVHVPIWPLTVKQLPGWLTLRARKKGLNLTPQGITALVERTEGNLLAAAQELDKLYLLHGAVPLNDAEVVASVVDNARFDVFGFVDTVLSADVDKINRVIKSLQSEGVEPILVLWALTREARVLAEMSRVQKEERISVDQVIQRWRIWDARKPLIKRALNAAGTRKWWYVLEQAGQIDRTIKGDKLGNAWDDLLRLAFVMADSPLVLKQVEGYRENGYGY
ncbi:DNA polymerase III delta subunit [hydrothermal vent metagenome]|uniref:DNA polymerase III subunit delta n=1 Tax=hydrothermal vent metagenome TaxID=652676 RepID=A0A3B0ZKJ0_9ZZZZ